MAQFTKMVKVELTTGAAPVVQLGRIFYSDVQAQRIGVIVTLEGQAVSLSGTCSGTAILNDGSTVPLTGTVSGNEAYIDLDSSCYAVEGPIQIFLKLSSGGVVTTLLAAVGTVSLTETGTVIDPGTVIPSVSALIESIEDAVDSIPADYSALLATIAPTFSTSTAYAAGTYAWYSGTLYRFTVDHAAGSWTGSDAVAVVIGAELSALKSAIDNDTSGFYPLLLNASKNSYIDKNSGELKPYANWMASDWMNCDGVDYLYITTPTSTTYGAFYSDKDETTRVGGMQISSGSSKTNVPQNAKYFRISNTNSAMQATTIKSKDEANVLALRETDTVINSGYKNIGKYTPGEYVDNTTGNFVPSASYKRTDYIDISEYKGQIYFESNVRTPFCCFYNASYSVVGTFIIQAGETIVNIPANAVYCAFSMSRYNTDIIMYDSTMTLVKSLGISSIRDIDLKYLDKTDTLTQMIQKPLMLVYTDLHGASSNFDRMTRFWETNLNAYVMYPVNLGDIVPDQATESIAFMDNSLGKASLMVIGNHDVLVNSTLPGITSLEAYNKYIAPNVAEWGVVQPANAATNGYNYYYKDTSYSQGTIRLIVLDEYFYDQTQHEWFVATLADAKTNGYSVIVCQHQSNVLANQASALNDQFAFATPELGFDLYIVAAGYSGSYSNAAENRVMAVDDFIGAGGKFICWMSGHTHSDQCHTFERTHGKQLSLVFSNAGMSMTSSKRVANYSSDCFQYVAFDLAKKYVYVLRIGEAVDAWFHKNEFLLYDYANHMVKEYH